MTWWLIRGLRMIGQAYDVKDKLPKGRKADDVPAEEADAVAVSATADTAA